MKQMCQMVLLIKTFTRIHWLHKETCMIKYMTERRKEKDRKAHCRKSSIYSIKTTLFVVYVNV